MSPIDAVLSSLVRELENGLQAVNARPDPWIVFGPPGEGAADRDGSGGLIRATVLSVASDTAIGRFEARRSDAATVPVDVAPPLAMDVHLAFVPDFGRAGYLAGIGMMSEVIALLQDRPVFEAEIPCGRTTERVRLPVEHVNLDLGGRRRAAAILGAAGQLFVVYRLRRLPFRSASFGAVASRVRAG